MGQRYTSKGEATYTETDKFKAKLEVYEDGTVKLEVDKTGEGNHWTAEDLDRFVEWIKKIQAAWQLSNDFD